MRTVTKLLFSVAIVLTPAVSSASEEALSTLGQYKTEIIPYTTSSASPITIDVPADSMCHILDYLCEHSQSQYVGMRITKDSKTLYLNPARYPTLIEGPATLELFSNSTTDVSRDSLINYRIFTKAFAYEVTPSNAVVIPASASGSADIQLETSTDLVNWTIATPGTYAPGNEGKFFRVRAQLHE